MLNYRNVITPFLTQFLRIGSAPLHRNASCFCSLLRNCHAPSRVRHLPASSSKATLSDAPQQVLKMQQLLEEVKQLVPIWSLGPVTMRASLGWISRFWQNQNTGRFQISHEWFEFILNCFLELERF